ncbi:unnamed protein product [Tilletia controversa]|nr:unnamed protein product [Tilletia controversa]
MKTTRSSPWPTNLVFPSTSPRHGLPPSHTQDTCSASSTGEQVCPPSKWPPTAPTSTFGSHNQFIGSKMPNASLANSSTHPASPVVLDAPRHLTRLIGFVNIAVRSNAHPRAQRHGSAALDKDIEWWREHLCGEEVWRSFSQYAPKDINLFVDASSDWELVFDNTGIQFGVPRGRMRNAAATSVIDRIHALQVDRDVVIHIRRVASADNPADGPSRGIRKEHRPPDHRPPSSCRRRVPPSLAVASGQPLTRTRAAPSKGGSLITLNRRDHPWSRCGLPAKTCRQQ